MRKFLIAAAIVSIVALMAFWFLVLRPAHDAYDRARAHMKPMLAEEMNTEAAAFVAEVRSSWLRKSGEADSVTAEAVATAGLQPTVAGFVELVTYRMPDYSYLFQNRNRRSATIGMVRGMITPISMGGKIYVSADRQLAFIRTQTDFVLVYSAEESSLRETLYQKKNDTGEVETK